MQEECTYVALAWRLEGPNCQDHRRFYSSICCDKTACLERRPSPTSLNLQANAEPDLRQTGKRLRGVIDDLIEGVLQLVADPFAEEKVRFASTGHGR